ncbi:MAG TPA: hypothetical protein VHC19_07835, partial [Pirellulales bacterium]|nr:hypothetical protein [Pirellulales bacterium]
MSMAAPPPPRFETPPPPPRFDAPAEPAVKQAPVQTVSQSSARRSEATQAPSRTSILAAQPETTTIDMASALDLAGVRNPEIRLARERVTETAAIRQFAA